MFSTHPATYLRRTLASQFCAQNECSKSGLAFGVTYSFAYNIGRYFLSHLFPWLQELQLYCHYLAVVGLTETWSELQTGFICLAYNHNKYNVDFNSHHCLDSLKAHLVFTLPVVVLLPTSRIYWPCKKSSLQLTSFRSPCISKSPSAEILELTFLP
jgi:hypothetical protein